MIKENEVEFCLSELPEEVNKKGEVLNKLNYCTKFLTITETKEVNGKITTNKQRLQVFLNYDSMLQQILNKYGVDYERTN